MASTRISFFTDMVQQIAERGRALMGSGRRNGRGVDDLRRMADELLSNRGEASSVARARALLDSYAAATVDVRVDFLCVLAENFGPDEALIGDAIAAYQESPGPGAALRLHRAAEPRRQELLRKLNRAPGGTLALLRMREDLIAARGRSQGLADVDSDFQHLFNSWFNRGFLTLQRITWASPAEVLEKIIAYEAVHRIANFEDLKGRLAPEDRRLYAFFHPALVEEPLIFVEVALTEGVAGSIQEILSPKRRALRAKTATTAVFYSISNCQKGLAGISFGNFLIKQVVEELRRDLPQLKQFITLSPVPGFGAWLREDLARPAPRHLTAEETAALSPWREAMSGGDAAASVPIVEALEGPLGDITRRLAATYLAHARRSREGGVPRPRDPVARFHLGNGARLEQVHARADISPKGLSESVGVMVNYLYDLDSIERRHEAYAERGEIALSAEVRRLARPLRHDEEEKETGAPQAPAAIPSPPVPDEVPEAAPVAPPAAAARQDAKTEKPMPAVAGD